MDTVKIFTDGSCSPNPGTGGWAALIYFKDSLFPVELKGAEKNTTNNRMEIKAVIEALKRVDKGSPVEITTDSQYLYNAFNKGWIESWKRKGWKTRNNKKVKNIEMWEELLNLLEGRNVTWHWIESHNNHPENTKCDRLANQARKELERGETENDEN